MSSTTNKRSTNGQSRRIIPFTAWTMTYPLMVVMSAFVLTMTLVGIQPVESKPLTEKHPLTIVPVKLVKEMKTELTDVAAITDTYTAPAPAKPAAQAVVVGTSDAMQFIFQHESGGRLDAVNGGGCIGLGQDCNGRLASVCPNWRTDRDCQMGYWQAYMQSRYGTWERAAAFWQSRVPINGRDVGNWW